VKNFLKNPEHKQFPSAGARINREKWMLEWVLKDCYSIKHYYWELFGELIVKESLVGDLIEESSIWQLLTSYWL